MALFDDAAGTRWRSDTPRAQLDPALESFASQLLPAPEAVAFQTRTVDPVTGPSDWMKRTVAELGMSALDVVFEAPSAVPSEDGRWGRRIRALVVDEAPGEVEIDFTAADGLTMIDLADCARAVRALFARARPLGGQDLAAPDDAVADTTMVAEAETRVAGLETGFRPLAEALRSLLPAPTEDDPHPVGTAPDDAVRAAMTDLSGYELPGAVPTAGWLDDEVDRAALWMQAAALGDAVTARLDALDAVDRMAAEDPTPTEAVRLGRAQTRLAAILGRAFPLVTRFRVEDGGAMSAPFERSTALTGGDPGIVSAFLSQAARVRSETSLLEEVRTVTELLVDEMRVELSVAQLPSIVGEPWAAVSALPEGAGGRICLLAVDHGGLARLATGVGAGLVIDEWTERIPKATQTTGVAFHYDAPTARAPQSMLLAVTPDGETAWSFDLILSTLLQTLEDAQIRAVGPQTLDKYGHHLPAIFSPVRLQGDLPESE